jgi:hypothetical protein
MDSQGHLVAIQLIKGAWKVQANYPVRDGVTYAYCAPEHVAAEMDRLVAIHADQIRRNVSSEVQAAWLHHRFTQIHPFQDGNGRVARAIASLVLVKDGLFPLVVTRDDKPAYLDALEAADQGDLKPLINMIARMQITQFRKVAAKKLEVLRGVFDLAGKLQDDLDARLQAIVPGIVTALHKVAPNGTAFVSRSSAESDHYFRAQIIENAKFHLHYFVDTSEYRAWIALNMSWSRRARLGKPFNGSLICAPFMEFRDTDEESQVRSAFVPVAEEGFVFFYNEAVDRLLARFAPWREGVLKVALKELTQNL